MVRYLLGLFLLLVTPLCAHSILLKEKLGQASPGSYLVIEQNKTFTFFHIHDRSGYKAIIEEVSIPTANFARNPMHWKAWFESGAPGNTSWIASKVNLETGHFEEAFSFTHHKFIDMGSSNSFLTTLLNLPFQEVSLEERRRIGVPPGHHKADQRPLWNPRLVVDGFVISNTSFYAYKARWPSDKSELSRKVIEIYLPTDTSELVPSYFPFWIEVEGKLGSAKARVVDSGFNAKSPKSLLNLISQ